MDQKATTALLLWRPAYNLFTRNISNYNPIKGQAQAIFEKGATLRNDTGTHFDAYEQNVLRVFLGLK